MEPGSRLTNACRLIDGKLSDKSVEDSLFQMVNLLQEKRDRALSQHWGLWLLKRSPEHGLKVRTTSFILVPKL